MPEVETLFTQKPGAIATYDKLEAESGAGYATYYCINSTTKILSKLAIPSQIPFVQTDINSTTMTLVSEIDWDLDYTSSVVVAAVPQYACASVEDIGGAGAVGMEVRLDLEVLHVSAAAVETSLGTTTGAIVAIDGNSLLSTRLVTSVTPSDSKLFTPGDKLRITTAVYARRTGAGGLASWRLWTDGNARGNTVSNQVSPISGSTSLGYKNSTDLQIRIGYKPILG